jgi:hypothetical protein
MPNKFTPNERQNWCRIKEQTGRQLKEHYEACTTEELPPRLLAVLKKLDEELEPSTEQVEVRR